MALNYLLFAQDNIDWSKANLPHVDAGDSQIKSVLNYVFVIIGAVSVLMIMVGGIRYMLSAGDPQRTGSAKNTVIYALIGLVVAVAAFSIVNFVLGSI